MTKKGQFRFVNVTYENAFTLKNIFKNFIEKNMYTHTVCIEV